MKNLIFLLIIGLSFQPLSAQNRVDITEIKMKKKKVIAYKTDYKTHYTSRYIYFLDGKKYNGIIFENWNNGILKREFEVKNGKRDGFNRTYYSNGSVEFISSGTQREMEIGEYILGYHKNGEIMYVHSVLSTEKEGNRLTTNTMYHSNGQIRFTRSYKDAMPHGLHLLYDDKTGELRHQTSYQNGERHGLEISYPLWGNTKREKWVHGKRIISNL